MTINERNDELHAPVNQRKLSSVTFGTQTTFVILPETSTDTPTSYSGMTSSMTSIS